MAPGTWDTAGCYLHLPVAPCWIHILRDINSLWAAQSYRSNVFMSVWSVIAVLVTRGVTAPGHPLACSVQHCRQSRAGPCHQQAAS